MLGERESMFLEFPRIGRKGHIRIIVGSETEGNLQSKCFRRGHAYAGNFIYWRNVRAVFGDMTVRNHFLEEVEDAIKSGCRDNSVCIDCVNAIGWAGVDEKVRYPWNALLQFKPNHSSSGLRIHPSRCDILAPLTPFLTIVYSMKQEGPDTFSAIVHSMYAGNDIGEIRGDVSEREDVVFFDWDHPGVRI